jgi:hypothetical protein
VNARGRRLVFAQTMDALTFAAFYVLIGPVTHAEQNPVVLTLMSLGGVQLVVFLKVGISIFLAWRIARPVVPNKHQSIRVAYRVMSTTMISLAVAAGIVGAGFNVASIIDSIR